MDERSVLIAQIEVLNGNLRRAKKTLDYPKINQDLSQRVRPPLSIEIQEAQANLDHLREEVAEGQDLDACWDSFRDRRRECERIFRECLAFVQGALVRSVGLDDGLCQVADALLVHLSYRANISWQRFTMLAEGEFLVDIAQVIRLGFPDVSVWTLPIAAHEFGHFVGPELKEKGLDGKFRHPFEDLLETERLKGEKYWSYLHEHFADIFATYALGPAFACTCILLRFDPRTAYDEKARHPSDAKRVYLILKTLEKMGSKAGGFMPSPYQFVTNKLGELWRDSLVATKRPANLGQTATLPLDDLLDQLYLLLQKRTPDVQYEGWLRAQTLSEQLHPDQDIALKFDKEATLPDALNAAWHCRLQHWGESSYALRRMEERAVDLCLEIAKRQK